MSDAHWYPLALSADIAAGSSAGAVVNGQEVVVWRDTAGRAHAWEDRCPHRGMKLSFGFVRGDHIACLYHGWEYGADGRCRYIPAHPDLEVPATICTNIHDSAERAGMIWVRLPGPDANDSDSDGATELPEDAGVTPVRSLYVDAALDDVLGAIAGDPPDAPSARGAMARPHPNLLALGDLRIGLHTVGPDRCALHIALAGSAGPERCLAMAHWAEALRLRAETAPAAQAAQ